MKRSAILLLVLAAACGSDKTTADGGAMVCVPGASVACVGKGGCSGAQICNASGTALGACDCGNDPDSGMMMTDGGMDEGGDAASTACVAALAAGYDFTCALKFGGTVWCWGANGFGQLGDGTMTPKTAPVQVSGLGNVTQLSAGTQFACARKGDGTAWCWGSNNAGQLGSGSTSMGESTPVQVTLGNAVSEIAAGSAHSCARKNDGTVWCIGNNNSGALGLGMISNMELTPVQMQVGANVVSVSASSNHTCIAKSDGTVWCAGRNTSGELGDGSQGGSGCGGDCKPTPAQSMISNVATVKLGPESIHSCAIKKDASLWCWGFNNYGEVGDGMNTNRLTPIQVLANVSQVGLGNAHTCATTMNGSMWCWGFNGFGQLGNGTFMDRSTPAMVMPTATTLTAGSAHACALTPSPACWGWNKYAQLGDGTTAGQKCTTGGELACRPSPVTIKGLCP